MPYTSPLEELRRADEPGFGGKSANLGELLAAGIPVPPGFALSTEALAEFLRASGLDGEIARVLGRVTSGDLDGIGAASRAIAETMRSAPLPEDLIREVERCYGALPGTSPPVAVRSSAVGEDSQQATFAGQQESYLWIRGATPVCDAIRDCWVSLFGVPAMSYRARQGETAAFPTMGVTVQLMVDAVVSGVMFTCNPVSGDRSMVTIDASWGLGLAVVGGEVTPDHYLVSKVTGEVVNQQLHDKEVQYVHDPAGRGAVRREVAADRRQAPCLDAEEISSLLGAARQVERHFGSPQDIEWAIDQDGAWFIVQSRPVTAVRKLEQAPAPADALSLVMRTFGADRG